MDLENRFFTSEQGSGVNAEKMSKQKGRIGNELKQSSPSSRDRKRIFWNLEAKDIDQIEDYFLYGNFDNYIEESSYDNNGCHRKNEFAELYSDESFDNKNDAA